MPGSKLDSDCFGRAMAYRNTELVYKFTGLWNISEAEALDVFEETKKFIWLAQRGRERGISVEVSHPTRILDEMWHTFILFTRDYARYCEEVYGELVHHQPALRAEHEAFDVDPGGARRQWYASEEQMWRMILEEFDVDTLLKWYVAYPLRFNQDFFRTQAIPLEMTWVVPASLAECLEAHRRRVDP
jgi:hypothetical protein